MSKSRVCLILRVVAAIACLFCSCATPLGATPASSSHSVKRRISSSMSVLGTLPLGFEPNRGQTDRRVDFLSRGAGYTLFLTPKEAVFTFLQAADFQPDPLKKPAGASHSRRKPRAAVALRMEMVHGNAHATAQGEEPLPGVVSYLHGRDTARWKTGVPTCASVRYTDIYPGVDVRYYGTQGRLEYDFVVRPGADTRPIALRFRGAKAMQLGRNGELAIAMPGGQILWKKPLAYQINADGQRQFVASRYLLDTQRQQVRFVVGHYDARRPLIVDPALCYSTFLGGTGDTYGETITRDASGCAYVAGESSAPDFPITSGAFQTTQTNSDVFVSKLNPTGTSLLYSTFLGGNDTDYANGIAVDANGTAYVTGYTASFDFPTTAGAFQTVSGAGLYSAYVVRLNATGTGLLYSTFLGGTSDQIAWGICIDNAGNAYVTGNTTSSDFPVTMGAYQTVKNTGVAVFIAKINPAGSALAYATFLNGTGDDFGQALAIDANGNAYVTGHTTSTDFPTTSGAYQSARSGTSAAFVTELNASGSALVYSTYLSGGGDDYAQSIALDADHNAYIAGYTTSTGFASPGSFQTVSGGSVDGFILKLNASGNGVFYSTYLGGTGNDYIYAVCVDSRGNAYVTGTTSSTDFPTRRGPFRTGMGGGVTDGFVGKLSADGKKLLYATYLGGKDADNITSLALDEHGNVYVTGYTLSSDFPITPGAIQTTLNKAGNCAFVCKLPTGLAGFDTNKTGGNDLLWQNQLTGDGATWVMNGLTRLDSQATWNGIDTNWQIVCSGDFHGDGQRDLLWQNQKTGDVGIWYMFGKTYLGSATVASGLSAIWRLEACADINGDGQPDLVWHNTQTGDVYIWVMNGIKATSGVRIGTGIPEAWHIVATADLNHDGNPDLLWQNAQTGDVAVWYMQGTSRTASVTLATNVPPTWKVAGLLDVDGSGQNNLLWQNVQTGDVYLWYMDGATYMGGAAVATGIPPSWRVIGTR